MPMLVALLAGWIFMEGQLPPETFTFSAGNSAWYASFATPGFLIGMAFLVWAAWTPREGRGPWLWLVAFAAGASVGTLAMETPFFRLGPLWGVLALAGLAGLGALRGPQGGPLEENGSAEALERPLHPAWFALAGFAMALPLAALGRRLWRLGMSESADLQINLVTFLWLMAAGAIAFGRLIPKHKLRFGAGLSIGAFALLCLVAHRAAETLSTHRGLRTLVRRFDLDLSYAGTAVYGILVTVSILILPAFALGTLLHTLQNRKQRQGLAIGAILGVQFFPALVALQPVWEHAWGPTAVALAAGVCATGLVAGAIWIASRRWVWGVGGTLAILGATALYPFEFVIAGKPWSRELKEVHWAFDTPQGQIAVQTDGMHGFSVRLDQVQITPTEEWHRLDQRLLQASVVIARDLQEQAQKPLRVLFSGVLTPERFDTLHHMGIERIDRVATYWRFGNPTEKLLFEQAHSHGETHNHGLPQGAWMAPATAWKRIQEGQYDLVIVPPAAPGFANLPNNTLQVQWSWVDRLATTPELPRGEDAAWLLCNDGLQRFAVGTWSGRLPASNYRPPQGVWRVPAPDPYALTSRLNWMSLREWDRPNLARQAFFEALAKTSAVEARQNLFQALAQLQSIQRHSSPFESEAQQLELSPDLTQTFAAALSALPVDGMATELTAGLARTLVGKREVGPLMEWIPPLSQRLGEPYELERALARGELESLEPAKAAARLTRLHERFPRDTGLLEELGLALDQSGQPERSKVIWGQILAQDPTHFEAEKAWVMALLRSGDRRAKEALKSLQDRFPDDLDLQNASQIGPSLDPEPGYKPIDPRHDGHDHDE